MNFLNILFSVCRGTGIFPFLVRIPVYKAFFHFLILAFACTAFIVAARAIPEWKQTYEACSIMENEFGSFLVTHNGLFPAKKPETSRAVTVGDGFLVEYQTGKELDLPMDDGIAKKGIVWTPLFLGSWNKIKEDSYLLTPIIYDTGSGRVSFATIVNKAEMESYISKSAIKPASFANSMTYQMFHELEILNFVNAAPVFLFMILGGLFFSTIANIIFSTIIFAAIFSLVYNFMRDRTSPVSGMNIFVVTLYASFPPVIIASLFPAFELPYLDFQTVHMFALLGYLFIVFNKVQQSLTPQKKSEDDLDV